MSRNKHNPADFVGKRFGSLTVTGIADTNVTAATYCPMVCLCDCGKQKIVKLGNLRAGGTLSCGCRMGTRIFRHGRATRDHRARPNAYNSWVAAKERCFSPGNVHFQHYGGRGITMCDRWRYNFDLFLADLGERPDGYTLERIDVNGNYEPGNCKWIPASEQMDNLRCSIRFTICGEAHTAKTLAPLIGRTAHLIRAWHYYGIAVRKIEALRPEWKGQVVAYKQSDESEAA